MQFFGFFLTTICSTLTSGYAIAYGVLLMGIVLQFFLTNTWVVALFYTVTLPSWFPWIRGLMEFYPAYHYSKIFADITMYSGGQFDQSQNRWVEGRGFTMADLYHPRTGKIPFVELEYYVPPPEEYFWKLVMTIIFYWFSTWYFDNVIAANRGTSKSFYFFLELDYWKSVFGSSTYKRKSHEHKHVNSVYDDFNITDSVKSERERVLENQKKNNDCFGLRILGLNKVYNTLFLCFKGKNTIHAVKDCYLEVDDGELLALLGHNGAGKKFREIVKI
jgi:hypothetical protein